MEAAKKNLEKQPSKADALLNVVHSKFEKLVPAGSRNERLSLEYSTDLR